MAEVEVTFAKVDKNLAVLDDLETSLERLVTLVEQVRAEQGPARWTTMAAAAGFRTTYATSLEQLERHLARLRVDVVEARRNLKRSTQALVQSDEEARASMQSVAARLDPPSDAPGPSAPADAPGPASPSDAPNPFAPTA